LELGTTVAVGRWSEVSRLREPEEPAGPGRAVHADSRAEDRQLAEACRAGEPGAFQRLFEVHGPRLKSLAWGLLGNVLDAEDAVQETFLRVYRGIGGFRGQSSFATWGFRILLNCATDIRRRKARRQEISEGVSESKAHAGPHAPLHDHPLRLSLEKALRKLSPQQRGVFLLFEVEGFKHSEVAEILDISEMTSRTALYEAKRSLRRLLFETGKPL